MEADTGNIAAKKVLELRTNSNFLITTVLWGNLGINVLLTLLSNSAKFLDASLGKEGVDYIRENNLKAIILADIEADRVELA